MQIYGGSFLLVEALMLMNNQIMVLNDAIYKIHTTDFLAGEPNPLDALQQLTDEFEKSTRCGEERAKRQWAIRSLIDAGCEAAFGTDYPVVGFNPYPSLHAAVTRCFADGKPCSTNPEQEIKDAKTIMTMVNGRIVFEA
jgi:predicted amidohydrolase YtcJ